MQKGAHLIPDIVSSLQQQFYYILYFCGFAAVLLSMPSLGRRRGCAFFASFQNLSSVIRNCDLMAKMLQILYCISAVLFTSYCFRAVLIRNGNDSQEII